MKVFKKVIICLVLSLFIIPFSVRAESSEYFYLDDNVDYSKEVQHNMFVFGNTLNENGVTKGILFAFANDLTSKSEMDYGVMLGNNVTISSEVANDLFLAGNIIKINNATINRDAYISGNSVKITNSTIDNTLFLAAETLKLDNVTINGDVNVAVTTLEVSDNVIINGNLYYNEDAKVNGLDKLDCHKETYESIDVQVKQTKKEIYIGIISSVLGLLLVAILISAIYSKAYLKVTMDMSVGEVFKYLGLGILLIIAVPIISIFLMISLVGLPLGLILLVLYGLAIYLSLVWSGMLMGRLLHIKNRIFGTIIGVLIVKGLTYVPYVGGFFFAVFMLIGVGLTLKVMKPTMKSKKKDNEIVMQTKQDNVVVPVLPEVTSPVIEEKHEEVQKESVQEPKVEEVKENTNLVVQAPKNVAPIKKTATPKEEVANNTKTAKKQPVKKETTKKTPAKKTTTENKPKKTNTTK